MPLSCGWSVQLLTVSRTVVLIGLGSLVGSGTGNELMGEGGLVVWRDAAGVVLLVRAALVRIVCSKGRQ